MVSVSEALVLVPSGSVSELKTLAVFVWLAIVELGTVNLTVTVALAPETIVPRSQVKLGLPLHVPSESVTVPRVNPDGKESVRLTNLASDGPPFETVIV